MEGKILLVNGSGKGALYDTAVYERSKHHFAATGFYKASDTVLKQFLAQREEVSPTPVAVAVATEEKTGTTDTPPIKKNKKKPTAKIS